jgi:SAM-dependent methyltransferase
MKDHSDIAWERWGQQDPYFGVLTQDKYRKHKIGESQAEFFESGEKHVTGVLDEIEKRFGGIHRARALDFGCGVGRLLIPLSRQFGRVTGVDVSKAMLEETSRNLSERQIENVELVESDDELSKLGSAKFDFIHTFIVLQHIAPKRGYVIMQNLLQHLAPGGAFFMHVSLRSIDSSVKGRLRWLRNLVRFVRGHFPYAHVPINVILRREPSEPAMEMNDYDLVRTLSIFKKAGAEKVITELETHGTYLSARFYSKIQAEGVS